jgi:hypothetical protein
MFSNIDNMNVDLLFNIPYILESNPLLVFATFLNEKS